MSAGVEWCPDCDGHGVTVIIVGSYRHLATCCGCNGTGRTVNGNGRRHPELTEAMRKTCLSKATYPTRGCAANVLARLRKRGVAVVAFYKCPVCRLFHLTSVPRKKKGRCQDEFQSNMDAGSF